MKMTLWPMARRGYILRPGGRALSTIACKVVSLVPLTHSQLKQIEACAPPGGPPVEASALSPNAVRVLRRSNSNPSEGAAAAEVSLSDAEQVAAVAEIDALLGEAEVWYGSSWDPVPGSKYLETTRFPPSLRWLCVSQAGASAIGMWLHEEGRPLGLHSLAVTNVSGIHGGWMAEWVLGFMHAHCMRLPTLLKQQERREWHMLPTTRIKASTVLVVGLGAIGEEVARLCQANGASSYGR